MQEPQAAKYDHIQFRFNVSHLTKQQAEDLFNKIAKAAGDDERLEQSAYIFDSNGYAVF